MIRSLFRFLADSLRLGLYAGVFFMIMVGVSYFAIGHYIQGRELPTPNLIGKQLSEATKFLDDEGTHLSVQWLRYQPNSSVPEDTVVDQSPKPGTLVKDGTPIRVVVSTREALVTIPDLRGETRALAGIKLRDLGLDVGSIAYISRKDREGGIVLETDPPPGTGIVANSRVNLLLSEGAVAQTRRMPTLTGLRPSQARELLSEYGLATPEEYAEAGGGLQQAGRIFRQTPSPGEPITPSTPIQVFYEPMLEGEGEEGVGVFLDDMAEAQRPSEQPSSDDEVREGFGWIPSRDRGDNSREERSGRGERR